MFARCRKHDGAALRTPRRRSPATSSRAAPPRPAATRRPPSTRPTRSASAGRRRARRRGRSRRRAARRRGRRRRSSRPSCRPSRSLRKSGRAWPTIAPAPASTPASGETVSENTSAGTNPFAVSSRTTGTPYQRPYVRQTFVAPMFPLPRVRMSSCLNRRTSQYPERDRAGEVADGDGERELYRVGIPLRPTQSFTTLQSRFVEERVDVGGAVGLVVEEVRVLVDVERDERRRVPHRERVLRVADVVEETALVPVVRGPRPAARGHAGGLEVGAPRVERAEVALDQVADGALRISAVAAEVVEVDLVVLDPADREREVDLERADSRSRSGSRRRARRRRAGRGSRSASRRSPGRACSALRPPRARSRRARAARA